MRAQTEDVLARWAADKPFFEQCRRTMGLLLQPDANGNSVVPLKAGAVDLDRAYEVSCMMIPEVAAQIQQQKQTAANKLSRDQAERARRGAASLSPGAPGRNTGSSSNKPTKGKSVRETLLESIDQARGGSRI